jgi:FkbM family methyltransferase
MLLAALRLILSWVLRLTAETSDDMQSHAARRARRLPKAVWATDPVVQAQRHGNRYTLDLRDNVQRAFYFTGWYEKRYTRTLIRALRAGDVFLDVGAHVGTISLPVARHLTAIGGGRVIAVEPATDTAKALQGNVDLSGVHNIDVVQVALGARPGSAALHSDPVRFDAADVAVRSFYGPGGSDQQVDVITFDSWAEASNLKRLDVIKIDVEGAELAVLEGMAESIRRHRPRLIGVEIRDYLLRQAEVSEQALREWLDRAGYRPVEAGNLEGNFLFELR